MSARRMIGGLLGLVVGITLGYRLMDSSDDVAAARNKILDTPAFALPTFAAGKADGTWTQTDPTGTVTLVLAGATARITSPHDCSGTFGSGVLDLVCADGNKDREDGMVMLNDAGTELTVVWGSGRQDTLTRS